ncbi:glucose-1-phosphate adenylyltransferase [Acetohalobium arabaticum]|uniref:Glucose-1-phosphate adenylyltransferase n=1 Tax=Acetohalobium arabaticum (strain ATCC 49924 / DSM 5501 / Z-7288) TaxID=574087 RepID=D9QQ19_ACEAZ|nr:glucose-1-phosphate adenylyltransferase [Acetohalobium arabaticum]ADL12610.1 glucose-1-phosphate adenylyltransferase [Acetohalobium arabaticum DSM 5501]
METLAMVLAGGKGSRLDILSADRAKPSVPFAGKFRIIDFALSNCVNSGIYDVGILTQYLPRSLNRHIGIGKPWDLDRQFGGATLLQPYTGKKGGWYQGTAHAIYQNINYIKDIDPEYVIILSSDHVYKMDYSKMVNYHKEKGADLTIAVKPVSMKEASQFGILTTDEEMQINDFQEKPDNPSSNLASMGIYVFTKDVLVGKLEEFCNQENSDFGHHIIPQMIDPDDVFAYEFNGYWQDVGTLKSYWETNLELTDLVPEMNLYDDNWKLLTRSEEQPPVKFGPKGQASKSLISNGAIINGKVENSVISPGVFIEENVVIKDSIICNDSKIKQGTVINKSIIDKEVIIGSECQIGCSGEKKANFEQPEILHSGLNVIGKGAEVPAETCIEKNCRIFPWIEEDDFRKKAIQSGSTVRPQT